MRRADAGSSGFYAYWGKASRSTEDRSHHLLVYHSLDVAAVGQRLLFLQPRLLADLAGLLEVRESVLLEWLSFWLAIHDIGKFSDGFQNLRPDLLAMLQGRPTRADYAERHDALGYRLASGQKHEQGLVTSLLSDTAHPPAYVRDLLQPIISAVTGHHGKPPRLVAYHLPLDRQFPASVQRDVTHYLGEIKDLFPAGRMLPLGDRDPDEVRADLKRISWLVAGLAVAADWIGSNDTWFPYVAEPMPLEQYWKERAQPQAARAIAESGLAALPPSTPAGARLLYPKLTALSPLQAQVEKLPLVDGPQLFIVEEVTGGGKTEAAVTLAHRLMAAGGADGLYIALPTMATANAMHARIRDVYKKLFAGGTAPQFVLAHSAGRMALMLHECNNPSPGPARGEDTSSEECSAWLSDSRKKALLAHVGVGTIDQALLAILPARHQSMRLFGLCRKVLIVDEVHGCDDYVHRLLCTLLEFHASLGGSAILLSATLPSGMHADLARAFARGWGGQPVLPGGSDYPLVTHVSVEGVGSHPVAARETCARRVDVMPVYDSHAAEDLIRQRLDAGDCACWVRNTVDDALEAYESWVERLGADRVGVFHARFILGDRLRIESEVLRRFGSMSTAEGRRGRLLIATQVVEQSLDLDFDLMVSDLAPIDLVIQRAGRLRRHARDAKGNPTLGFDERGTPLMAVVMPEPVAQPSGDWYGAMFPRGRWVYGHHGQLWLTARWLVDHRGYSVPEDARAMIEGVYGDAASVAIPEGLRRAVIRATGNAGAMAAQGRLNSLRLEEGYQATATHWHDDVSAPTRLGDPTVVVRLGKWEQGQLVPLESQDSRHAWELSQLTIRKSRIAGEAPDIDIAALEGARSTMQDRGKWSVLLPLESRGADWIGSAVNETGSRVRFRYNALTGLRFLAEEKG